MCLVSACWIPPARGWRSYFKSEESGTLNFTWNFMHVFVLEVAQGSSLAYDPLPVRFVKILYEPLWLTPHVMTKNSNDIFVSKATYSGQLWQIICKCQVIKFGSARFYFPWIIFWVFSIQFVLLECVASLTGLVQQGQGTRAHRKLFMFLQLRFTPYLCRLWCEYLWTQAMELQEKRSSFNKLFILNLKFVWETAWNLLTFWVCTLECRKKTLLVETIPLILLHDSSTSCPSL